MVEEAAAPKFGKVREGVVFPFRISAPGLRVAFAVLTGAALLTLTATWLASNQHLLPSWVPYEGRFLVNQANLGAENLIGVWFGALFFLLVAPAALACFGMDLVAARSRRERVFALSWLALGVVSVLLSLSELALLHESASRVFASPFGSMLTGWVGVLAIPILAVVAFLLWFAWHWFRGHRPAFWLMVFGVLLYLTVPLQEHLEWAVRPVEGEYQRPVEFLLLEEGAEVFGAILLFAATAIYLLRRLRSLRAGTEFLPSARSAARLRFTGEGASVDRFRTSVEGTLVLPARAVIAGALAAVLLHGVLLVLTTLGLDVLVISGPPEEARQKLNWFPATLATATAAACIYLRYAAGRLSVAPGVRLPLLLAALFSLLVGVDYGSNLALTADLWEGSPRRQTAVRVAFVAGAVAVAALLWKRSHGLLRAAAVGWALFLAPAFTLPAGRPGVLLGCIAYALLLVGLVVYWVGQASGSASVTVHEEVLPERASSSAAR